MREVPSCKVNVPAYKIAVHVEVEYYVRIVPVNGRTLPIVVVPAPFDDCILEPERGEVAVSYPAAVRYGLRYGERLFRAEPVLPWKGFGMLIEFVRGFQFVIAVDEYQKPCCASRPHTEAICRLKVC